MAEEQKDVSTTSEEADLSKLLDSCLDDFNKPIPKPVPESTQPTENPKPSDSAAWSDEFKQFSEAMGNAMGNDSEVNEIQKLMESIVKDGPAIDDDAFAQSFAETIKELTEQAQNIPEASPDDLSNLLGGLGLGAGNPDPNSLPDLMPIVQNVMQKLMSKEMLYPSLKEIVEKYPGWLSENGPNLKPEELENYKQQHELMKQICAVFENTDSSKEAERKQFEQVVALMQKVQTYGNPPKDLVANVAPGTLDDLTNMHMPGMPEQCTIM